MVNHLPDTQPCYLQQCSETLTTTAEIPEPNETENAKRSMSMGVETTQHCQQQTVPPKNTEHQTGAPTSPTSTTIEPIPMEDQDSETGSLIHFYSCCKLSFIVKMASLQSVKALGFALSEEDVKREEESMEDARAKALEAWQKICDRGVSYDVVGSEYLRSCALQ